MFGSQLGQETAIERKVRLDGTTTEYACEALRIEPGRRAVLRYTSEREVALRGTDLVLPAGTVTIAHYWADRPYNVYHWLDGERTVGVYVSVADRTEIAPGHVSYRDLVIDVLLREDGAIDLLDEADLPSDLDPAGRRAIAGAVEAVVTSARTLRREVLAETAAHVGETRGGGPALSSTSR